MSGNIGPSGLVSTIASVERPVIRRVADPQRRVESPTERAVEDAITGNPGISREQWVPVPPRAVPARTAVINVHCIDVGFGQVLGTQGAEAVQVRLLEALLVELRRLQRGAIFHV